MQTNSKHKYARDVMETRNSHIFCDRIVNLCFIHSLLHVIEPQTLHEEESNIWNKTDFYCPIYYQFFSRNAAYLLLSNVSIIILV